ncbi:MULTISPECIES: hypothetical protein [Agrobacterium tumefaciens complex]|uniref:hypothetical protein n=1 Tax=Agrobacterium tumefaciens complex TaxID=1183400 RepID=UPI00155D89FC|nr:MULTISPECIES: hypothetical protein [Agrobacterium tumefaciens complex]WCK80320.1 hypothetical protein G6L39_026515 [Agrobacterium fabrum]WIC88727.1 hypothetical protein A6U93_27735 [Agrobacterium tumefaciens]
MVVSTMNWGSQSGSEDDPLDEVGLYLEAPGIATYLLGLFDENLKKVLDGVEPVGSGELPQRMGMGDFNCVADDASWTIQPTLGYSGHSRGCAFDVCNCSNAYWALINHFGLTVVSRSRSSREVMIPAPSFSSHPFVVVSTGLDFQTLVEHGYRAPIAFRTKDHLRNWAKDHQLTELSTRFKRAKDFERERVLVLRGQVQTPAGYLSYSQIWAHIDFHSYRAAYQRYVEMTYGTGVNLSKHDVDHAVSSKHLRKYWPQAWVNVLYAESGINRSIGALMEKSLPPPPGDEILFNLECLLKLFYKKSREKMTLGDVRKYYRSACSAFIVEADVGDDATLLNAILARTVLNTIASEYVCGFAAFDDVFVVAV